MYDIWFKIFYIYNTFVSLYYIMYNTSLIHLSFIFVTILILIIVHLLYSEKNKIPFEKIYLINLQRRPDRLEAFMKCYKNTDMKNKPIIKFAAIDGSKVNMNSIPITELAQLEMKQLQTTGFRHKHYQLTKGAIGCYLSHLKIWEHAYMNKFNSVLVFEDDARPPPNILHQIQKNYDHFPKDWDIILFGIHCHECEEQPTFKKVKRFILLHTYMINYKAIVKILNFNSLFPISQQLDAYLSEMSSELNIYSCKKNLVSQSNSRTDIQAPILKNPKINDRLIITNK